MLTLTCLYIYPIKSLGGISLPEADITSRGLAYDRRWMLVDDQNNFISQREIPALALFKASITQTGILAEHTLHNTTILVPFEPQSKKNTEVTVWDDTCTATVVSDEVNDWFSQMLSIHCKLVYMPVSTNRKVDSSYASGGEITSFSDGFPILMIGQPSLDDLNNRLSEPIPMNRFRPNIVFTGGVPFEEDTLAHFTIGQIDFYAVKPCARCVVTTIDQQTALPGKEPLKTLAGYRRIANNIYFGQNLLHKGDGVIKKGDCIRVNQRKAFMNFATPE